MKILSLHCSYFNFKPLKKAIKGIEDLPEEEKEKKEINEALAILTAVEKTDKDVDKSVEVLAEEVKKIAKQVNAENIVLYPYAHLSENLGSPEKASKILEKAQERLQSEGYKVWRAPFGYYKEFEMKLKGHPLSELSRELKTEESSGGEEKKGKEKSSSEESSEKEEEVDPKQILREISKSKLDTSKLKKNDHRVVGRQMDLFSFNEVAPGMPFFHDNGMVIINELLKYWREKHKEAGYEEVSTPLIMDKKLWKLSGHWNKYKENMFTTDYEGRDFAIKPMNCPGGMLVYKTSPKSYKDLPLRVGEIGTVHRQELSGNLGGLFRVIKITQDDAHIFCTEDQLEDELVGVIKMVDEFYKKFNLEFDHVELSTRPEKRIGSDEIWDKAEKALENVLKKRNVNYQINEGDGAFYGPKIDFHAKDSQGRTTQLSTIQLDFSTPERFDLTYNDENDEKQRPIMLHRVVYGAIERFLGILLEATNGRLPTWLAPIQARMINFTDRNTEKAKEVMEKIRAEIPEVRIEEDFSANTVQSKVRNAELMRVPYVLVIGDKEQAAEEIAVRKKGKVENVKVDDFISQLKEEIRKRK